MKTRIISALIALPLLFIILLSGGIALYISAFLLSIVGLFEFYKVFSNKANPVFSVGYIATLFWYLGLYMTWPFPYFTFVIMALVFILLGLMVFTALDESSVSTTLLGFFYVSFALSHIVMISNIDANFFIWFPFVIAFITDTFAYFTGKLIGKTPLIPKVSPNKTVEGALGGIIGAVVFSFIYARLWYPEFQFYAIFLGFFGSMLSQLGDLIASKIKRIFGVKDYGKLMPGHGGVLDRFDGILITTPLVYYFMVLFL